MQRPDDKEKIGSITIDIFTGNRSFCTFKGEVPPLVVSTCRISIQRDFGFWMMLRAAQEKERQMDRVRVKREAKALEDKKAEEVRVAAEKAAFDKAEAVKKAQTDVEVLEVTITTNFKPLELRSHEQKLIAAKKRLENVKK